MSRESKNTEAFFEVDAPAIMELEPERKSGARYRTPIRGWRRGVYVLLDLSEVSELSKRLERGQTVAVRFVAQGRACAFVSTVRDWQSSRLFPHLQLNWPDDVEYVAVRQYERVPVRMPCTVGMPGEHEAEGVVRDVSRGGCSVELPEDSEIERGAELEVSFDLPDGARVEAVRSFVRNIRPEAGAVIMGCCFGESLDKNTAADIEFFVTSTLERLRASPPSTQRILVLAPKHRSEESSIVALENLGFELQVAQEPVDAFFQLRLNRPAAFVAAAEGVLPGVEVCRLVRENRALTNLPIVVFRDGEPPDETEKKAVMEAGATRYVSGANPGKRLAEALEDVLAAFAK